jgi:hypothetical protein
MGAALRTGVRKRVLVQMLARVCADMNTLCRSLQASSTLFQIADTAPP